MKNHDSVPHATRDESRNLALALIGMKVTEAFYDQNQLVLEFNNAVRIQFSPEGLYIAKRRGIPEDQLPEELRASKPQ